MSTRRSIARDYGSTFYNPLPSQLKKIGLWYHWQSPKKGPLIVFHPNLRFDPFSADMRQAEILARSTKGLDWAMMGMRYSEPLIPKEGGRVMIFHESYRLDADVLPTIHSFIRDYPDHLRIPSDGWLWWDTGFWSSRHDEDNWVGVSELSAGRHLDQSHDVEFAYVLCNLSTIIALTTNAEDSGTLVDVYFNNRFLPFAEMRRAVRHTLDGAGSWASLEMQVDDKDKFFEGIRKKGWREPARDLPRFSNCRPLAVVKGPPGTYYSIVTEWKFGSTPWAAFDSMGYILASHGGTYWDESDLSPQSRFTLRRFVPHFLKNCVVVDCWLQTPRTAELPDSPILAAIQQDFRLDKL